MQVTEVRLTKTKGEDRVLAYGSVTLDDALVVNGIRVLESNEGRPFLSYPSRKNQKGEYKDVCYPLIKTLREDIFTAVMARYEELSDK